MRISGRGLPTQQMRWKSDKRFVDIRTPEFQSIRSSPGDDLKINVQLEGHAISLFSRSYTKALEMSHYKALYKSMDTLLYFVSRANILMSSTMQVGNSKQDHLLNNTLIRISVHIQ